MSLDDALERAGQALADYETSGARDESGLALVWVDQLAQVLRELAGAASAWRAGRDRPAVTVTGPLSARSGDGGAGRVRGWLGRMRGAGVGRAPEPGAVVLPAEDAAAVWQALADAGAWHGAYGDCAACVAAGLCANGPRHEQIAVAYAALRARLGSE